MADEGPPGKAGGLRGYLSPYERWNFGVGKGYAFPGIRRDHRYITALAELRPNGQTGPAPALANGGQTWMPTLWDPDKFGSSTTATTGQSKLTFYPFVIDRRFESLKDPDDLQNVLDHALRQYAKDQPQRQIPASGFQPRFRVAYPVPERAMKASLEGQPEEPAWTPDRGLRERIGDKRIVVMAVIDDGIPFAHRNFRDASGQRTRVEFCWLQSAVREDLQRSVLFGREYTRAQIEDHIKAHGDDEDALYRAAGATADSEAPGGSAITGHTTHGAHVMDLATGYAPERGEAPAEEIRIIAVQLPDTIALDTSGFGKDMYMLSAFHYIFERADRIAKDYGVDKLRLVINFSYGFSGGRHDGESELEAAIDQLVTLRRNKGWPTALVLPAGNIFLDRLHGMLCEEHFADGVAQFHWRLQPNDRTPSYLEIWFREKFDPKGYRFELYDPSGRMCAALDMPDDVNALGTGPGDPMLVEPICNARDVQIGQLSADLHRRGARTNGNERGRWRVLAVLAPSEPDNPDLPGIEAGRWTVRVVRAADARPLDAKHTIHCWIQRDADPAPFRSGSRQSYFEDARDLRHCDDGSINEVDTDGAFVQRFGSLNGLSTAFTSLMVAGFRRGTGPSVDHAQPATYSSAGTLTAGWPMTKVACSSLSDRSKLLGGTIAAGVRSGALSRLPGTSVAAPFVARKLAKAFVTEDEARVKRSARRNYRSLLMTPSEIRALRRAARPANPEAKAIKKRLEGRFGKVRVQPHWQPGLER